MTTQNPSFQRPKSTGSLIGGIALGLLIATMGTIFVFALVKGYGRANETREWTEVPMKVTRAEVLEEQIGMSPTEYKPIIEYAFVYEGKPATGSGIKRTEGFTKHKSKAQRTVNRYPLGSEGTCWVNPENPAQTVLKHNTRAVLYTVWFPGLFVIAGLGIAIGSIRAYVQK
ncbi:MAG: DUF3592 domain-containing protein [Verrucomicrobiales bacterium]